MTDFSGRLDRWLTTAPVECEECGKTLSPTGRCYGCEAVRRAEAEQDREDDRRGK